MKTYRIGAKILMVAGALGALGWLIRLGGLPDGIDYTPHVQILIQYVLVISSGAILAVLVEIANKLDNKNK